VPASTLRRGDVIRVRDERWTIDRHVTYANGAVVDVRGAERSNRGLRARFLLPFEPFERLPRIEATQVVSPRRWRHFARQTLAEATASYDSLRALAGAAIDLLPFQLEPALAVTRGVAVRILIADEVGLGKTIQAGLIVAETLERCGDARVLITAPAGLREQWCAELRDRFHLAPVALDSLTVSGMSGVRGANPWAAHRLIVTSVDYVKRPEAMRSLETMVWDLLVIDEAHRLAGRSDRNAALTLLGERARLLVMLTATPHSGDEAAFARLCAIGDLDHRFPLLVFRRTRDDAGLASRRRTTWLNVAMSVAETEMHRALTAYARLVWAQQRDASSAARLAMIVLMRRASSSAWSLAQSVERRLLLLGAGGGGCEQLLLPLGLPASDDEEPSIELGAPGLYDGADERRRLEQIRELAHAAARAESKFDAVRRLLRRTREPAIVFTEYRDTLAPLAAALPDSSIALLHGGLTAAERRDVLEHFRSGAIDVLLATDAASEGLNLQLRCRLVVNLELPWTPTRLEQRVGRVDRIGQRKRVHAVHLIAAGTSEELTVARLLRRIDRVADVTAAMRTHVASEQDVAGYALDRQELPPAGVRPDVPLPRGLIVTALRDVAHLEVERASVARVLGAGTCAAARPPRPFVAVARGRTCQSTWACRLQFTDPDGELIWDALVGVAFDGACRSLRACADIRSHADGLRGGLLAAVHEMHDRLRADVASALRTPVTLATMREEAIVAAAVGHSGRLAAALVQRGLFDRRAERAAADRDAEIEAMLTRCRTRLAQLAQRAAPVAAGVTPLFALVRRRQ
jgi:superfamily II DNA or RNA helicase